MTWNKKGTGAITTAKNEVFNENLSGWESSGGGGDEQSFDKIQRILEKSM